MDQLPHLKKNNGIGLPAIRYLSAGEIASLRDAGLRNLGVHFAGLVKYQGGCHQGGSLHAQDTPAQ